MNYYRVLDSCVSMILAQTPKRWSRGNTGIRFSGSCSSAADLKSLHCKPRNEPRDFKSKSGTRTIEFASAHGFAKFVEGGC